MVKLMACMVLWLPRKRGSTPVLMVWPSASAQIIRLYSSAGAYSSPFAPIKGRITGQASQSPTRLYSSAGAYSSPFAPIKGRITGQASQSPTLMATPAAASAVRVLPRAIAASSLSPRPSAVERRTAPPSPSPRLTAWMKAVMGQATLMAARPTSPRFRPMKKPSTMIKQLFSSWLSMLGSA